MVRVPPVHVPQFSCGYELACSRHLLACALVLLIVVVLGPVVADAGSCANSGVPGTPYEGFGRETTGGADKPIYRVSNLNDSGPGSLRAALQDPAGNRCIIFDVAGEIVLTRQIYTRGAFVTIDGWTAPSPGITLRNYGISIWGTNGSHDYIIRAIRIRRPGHTCASDPNNCYDGIQLKEGVSNVVIDHVSVDEAADGAIDIAGDPGTFSRNITVQWSILSGTRKASLVGGAAYRISMHHNLFIQSQDRSPQAQWDVDLVTSPPDTVLDFRNNVVWEFLAYGTQIRRRATGNVVNNYFYTSTAAPSHAFNVDLEGRAHARGNASGNGAAVDAEGNETSEFDAPPITSTDACRAAYAVRTGTGARGLNFGPDSIDSAHIAAIPATQLPACAAADSIPSPPPSGSPLAVSNPVTIPSPPPSSSPPAVTNPVTLNPLSMPDLVVTSLSTPATLNNGVEFQIKFGVTNRGTGSAASSRLRAYLSADNRLSSDDMLLRDRYITSIAPGASQWHMLTEVIPLEVKPGPYYLILVSDPAGIVNESNERNNVAVAKVTVLRPTPTTPTPDLVITSVSIPSPLRPGVGFPVKFNVANRGTGTSQASRLRIYLSTDAEFSAGDVLLRRRYISSLGPGAAQSQTLTEVIPLGVKPGSYYVVLVVDQEGAIRETSEQNNITVTAVTVR